MSKQMTPCERLGYKVGDKFKVVDGTGVQYAVGSFITLIHDDGSSCPRFNGVHATYESRDRFFPLDFVEKVAKLKPAKQALADAIHQNGGWRSGANWACQHGLNRMVVFSASGLAPTRNAARGMACWNSGAIFFGGFQFDRKLPNWHQCVLSRDEYYHAYPTADADGWIEHDGKHEPAVATSGLTLWCRWSDGLEQSHEANMVDWIDDSDVRIIAYRLHKPEIATSAREPKPVPVPEAKPTIEQLAHDYRNAKDYAVRLQKEADDAARSADAKLRELERAGESIGLIIGIAKQESAPVIIDWRDLKVGDEIRCIGDWQDELTDGRVLKVDDVEMPDYRGDLAVRVLLDDGEGAWGKDFEFISRP